jgi:23S rRNA-/tRNA-specific pseudouridylate synthase
MEEKAYKLLALQEGITNRSAKDLIDKGLVYAYGKRVVMARALMDARVKFRVEKIERIEKIYEDKRLIAVNKPAFLTSEQISKKFKTPLLHRLDKETSGLLLLVKDEEFQKEAIKAFKNHEVLKEYEAWVSRRVAESFEINKPILTIKKANSVFSRVSKNGKEAITIVEPLEIEGKFSKVKVTIKTGRTHQIRVHLADSGFAIVGDRSYGGKSAKRVMLHAKKIELLGYSFEAPTPKDFKVF